MASISIDNGANVGLAARLLNSKTEVLSQTEADHKLYSDGEEDAQRNEEQEQCNKDEILQSAYTQFLYAGDIDALLKLYDEQLTSAEPLVSPRPPELLVTPQEVPLVTQQEEPLVSSQEEPLVEHAAVQEGETLGELAPVHQVPEQESEAGWEKLVLKDLLEGDDEPVEDISEFRNDLQRHMPPNISITHCIAHTVNLAASKDIDEMVTRNMLPVKLLVKILRRPSVASFLREHKIGKPPMECVTRWMSRFDMCKYVSEKSTLLMRYTVEQNLKVMRSEDWEFVREYVKCFGPVHTFLLFLQKHQICHADVFAMYMDTLLKLKRINMDLATKLSEKLKARLQPTFNEMTYATMWLTPYGNLKLRQAGFETERELALEKLKPMIRSLYTLRAGVSESLSSSPELVQNSSSVSPDNELAAMVQLSVKSSRAVNAEMMSPLIELESLIRDLSFTTDDLEKAKMNNIGWWQSTGKFKYHEYYKLAQVVLSAPTTEVDSERTFSALKILMSDLRSRIGADLIDSCLVIQNNKDLLLEKSFVLECQDAIPTN